MRHLLDAHALIWALDDPGELGRKALAALENPANELVISNRDPFDRLLAAQCLVESIPIVSADSVFDQYGVTRVWD
jgi:PIN domain nuclease of toxin-antitoxin system